MMRTNVGRLFLMTLLLSTLVLVACSCAPKETTLIPREVLFGNPQKAAPKISPDGTMLAYVAPSDSVLNVWVKTIGKDDDRPITRDTGQGIYRYFWAADNKHIMYLQDAQGDENWRIYAVNLESGETRDLTPFDGVQAEIVDQNKRHPNTLIVMMNRDDPRLHDVYSLNVETGELTMVAKNPGNVAGWVTDYDLNVRGAVAATADGGFDLLVRKSETAPWEKILTWGPEDNLNSGPLTFSKDGGSLYLLDSRGANAGRLVKLDLATGSTVVMAEDSTYDVSDAMVNPDTYEIEAVCFTKERDEWHILDAALNADFEVLRSLDPGDFKIYSRDHADRTWIVGFVKDNGPVSYYSYNRDTKTGTFLFDNRPDLKSYALAAMEPMSYQARDGLTVHGYITYPVGKERTNLPLVLNVHGGPWYRDTWGYNPEAQWLANRGYACLQVNFRGSTGYGKGFVNAGDREWGGKMQDDLVDAVGWAVDQGIADPKRVGIMGGSYGGYATLVGATFTPDLFTCAVAACAPSNLITFIETVPPYWSSMLTVLYKRVGNPVDDKAFLESRSPLFKVDAIKIPLMIAHGANDPRVKQAEAEQIVEAMKSKGIPHEYLLFPDEGHGFVKPGNRLQYYAAAEQFLATNLGGRFEERPAGR
jgi:dipeptidyl aminopeptidase/acylaminoacyl peptidase